MRNLGGSAEEPFREEFMAIFASIKNVLDQNVRSLQDKQGFFANIAYAINKTFADLTPDTT